jgi:hypothetical protein
MRIRLLSAVLTTLLLAASVALTLLAVEVGFRAFQYVTLPGRLAALVAQQNPDGYNPRFRPDSKAGYLYVANFEGEMGHPWHSRWRTNSHGHIARSEYPKAKPVGEFRIAVIGDSFTAGLHNNVRWTEMLEDHLNASAEWRRRTADKATRVINFGVDGTGFVQFAAIARHYVPEFQPDLVIVNYVSDNVLRRMRYMKLPSSGSAMEDNFLDPIDWLGWRSEAVAATVGQRWGMVSQMPLDARHLLAAGPTIKFAQRQEALHAGRAAVTSILVQFPTALFLHMPCYYELASELPASLRGLAGEFQAMIEPLGARAVSLQPQMDALLDGKRKAQRPDLAGLSLHQIVALPKERWPELYRWFFLPDDLHYTDYALGLYANEVAKAMTSALKPLAQ